MDRPQKSQILYKSTEIEQETSKIGIIPIKIQFYAKVRSRKQNGKSRQLEQKAGLGSRSREK